MDNIIKLKIIAISSYLLLVPIVAYFKYFQTFISPLITNITILLLFFILTSLLIYGSFLVKKTIDVYFILPQTLMATFIVRAVPYLRFSDTYLLDSYCYLIATLNIVNYGTTEPILKSWYYLVGQQLDWPGMQLLTTALAYTTHIDVMQLFKFQEPIMGALLVLGTFIFAKVVTDNNRVALLSALFVSFSQEIINFQSQYHPQGLAFVYFTFFIYCYLKFKSSKNAFIFIPLLLFLFAFIISHHFSTLFVGLMAAALMCILIVAPHLPYLKRKFSGLLPDIREDFTLWSIIAVSLLSYHFFVHNIFVESMIPMLKFGMGGGRLSLLTVGSKVPIFYTLSNLTYYIFLALAAASVILVVKTKNVSELRCAVLLMCIILAEVANVLILHTVTTNRVLGFYVPLGALFASLTIYRVKDQWFTSFNKSVKVLILILICSMPMVAGVFNPLPPAYYFQGSGVNTFYYSSNDLSSLNRVNTTGQWIQKYTSPSSGYATEFDTLTSAFFYGARGSALDVFLDHTLRGITSEFIDHFSGYVVVNPSVPYKETNNKTDFLTKINVVYSNGVIVIGDTRNT